MNSDSVSVLYHEGLPDDWTEGTQMTIARVSGDHFRVRVRTEFGNTHDFSFRLEVGGTVTVTKHVDDPITEV